MAVSALDLRSQGLEFVRDPHASIVAVRGPKRLVAAAQAVARRVQAMRTPARLAVAYGHCDACGDAFEPFRAGWCELCCLARHVALKETA
jgi:hypothetical protein